MTLAVVSNYQPEESGDPVRTFEGEQVQGLRAKLTSTASLEVSEEHHHLDQTARLLVTGKVTRIDHVVDQRSGRLIRVETFKVVDAVEVAWGATLQLTDRDD